MRVCSASGPQGHRMCRSAVEPGSQLDRTRESGPGRPRDVEAPAAGEGQAVQRIGAHRLRGSGHDVKNGRMLCYY